MDDLTNHILVLLGQGKITKEAALQALSMNPDGVIKIADTPRSIGDTAKMVALTALLQKVIGGVEGGIGKLMSGNTEKHRNAVFQKLMREHPGLQGKDPIRAKANFDYVAQTAPHLLKHPLILGDNVANMTAMGATALDTLKTISDVNKDVTAKKPSDFSTNAAKQIAESLYAPKPVGKEEKSLDDLIDDAMNAQVASNIGRTYGRDAAKMEAEARGFDSSKMDEQKPEKPVFPPGYRPYKPKGSVGGDNF